MTTTSRRLDSSRNLSRLLLNASTTSGGQHGDQKIGKPDVEKRHVPAIHLVLHTHLSGV